jgi:hypothetical protein
LGLEGSAPLVGDTMDASHISLIASIGKFLETSCKGGP